MYPHAVHPQRSPTVTSRRSPSSTKTGIHVVGGPFVQALRSEFRSWKYKTDKDGKPLAADAFENGNNHLLDCAKSFFGTNRCFTVGKIVAIGEI
jgi:hypothetical protein